MEQSNESGSPLDFTTFSNVIDGQLSDTKATRYGTNPSTLEGLPHVPLSTIEDVDRAVECAKKASQAWAAVPWAERVKALDSFASAIEAQTEGFAQMLLTELGKPVRKPQTRITKYEPLLTSRTITSLAGHEWRSLSVSHT
jgi:acyl-CoA reductase-like NAD-dependent aldehyde dehydrogenase